MLLLPLACRPAASSRRVINVPCAGYPCSPRPSTYCALWSCVVPVYYVSAGAYRGEQLLLNIKLPFRVRVSPPYHSGHADEKAVIQLPLTPIVASTIEHKRLHPPQPPQLFPPSDKSPAASAATAVASTLSSEPASAVEKQHSRGPSFTMDDNGPLLSLPTRLVFPSRHCSAHSQSETTHHTSRSSLLHSHYNHRLTLPF